LIHKSHSFTVPEDSDYDLATGGYFLPFSSVAFEDVAMLWIVFLSPVQNEGSRFCLL
jgi:hypothetical protein